MVVLSPFHRHTPLPVTGIFRSYAGGSFSVLEFFYKKKMVGSSSHSHHQEVYDSQLDHPPPAPPRTAEHHHHHHMRQLLLCCAQLISSSDFSAALRLISFLSAASSPAGDSSDRLVHSFTKALSLRLHHHLRRHPPPQTTIDTITFTTPATTHCCNNDYDDIILQKSYLSLNQITPFIRFTQLTANQAILDAIDQSHDDDHHHHQFIHIIDFDTMHGVQWPPLMQAIANRHPPPYLRLTSTGTNPNILRKTGDRLSKFANSLGLNFQFQPILLDNNNTAAADHLSAVVLRPNETLVVNCVLYLHRLLKNRENLYSLLKTIKMMNPRVVTMAEIESNHNHPLFVSRFAEALRYYGAVFDSLEATLPPKSRERMVVERVWFGREIADVVAFEGERRHERFRSWEVMMRINGGFEKVSLSSYAISQARMLLRLHYPSEGYNLVVVDDCLCLGWRNQPLFSVSSWR